MGCGVYENQTNQIAKAMRILRANGFTLDSSPLRILEQERTRLLGNIGVKMPRIVNLLARFIGFSPGVIAIYHDIEGGFMSEARRTPISPPVYHFVSGDIAVKILRHDINDELEEFLMTPDENIDN